MPTSLRDRALFSVCTKYLFHASFQPARNKSWKVCGLLTSRHMLGGLPNHGANITVVYACELRELAPFSSGLSCSCPVLFFSAWTSLLTHKLKIAVIDQIELLWNRFNERSYTPLDFHCFRHFFYFMFCKINRTSCKVDTVKKNKNIWALKRWAWRECRKPHAKAMPILIGRNSFLGLFKWPTPENTLPLKPVITDQSYLTYHGVITRSKYISQKLQQVSSLPTIFSNFSY